MRKYLLIGLGVIALGVLTGMLIGRRSSAEVVFQGKSVKAWALEFNAPDAQRRDDAAAAFQALGSNAVPGLVRLLGTRDGFLRKQVWLLAPRLPSPLKQIVLRGVRPPQAAMLHRVAARSLGVIGPGAAAAVPALARALRANEADVRSEAAAALGRFGAPGVRELTGATTASDSNVRYNAVCGLGEARSDVDLAVPALLQALGDPSDAVRVSAGGSLSKLGTNALPLILRELESGTASNRCFASKAIGIVRPERARVLPALLTMADDPDPACRLAAVRALAVQGIPNDAMIDAFAKALLDPVAGVRLAAIPALYQAHLQAGSAVPNLIVCLNDPSAPVREWAARALGAIGSPAKPAVAELSRLTRDQEASVRAAAEQALAAIAKAEAVEADARAVESAR